MSSSAMDLNNSAARCCEVPAPACAYVSLPGCARASATSSGRLFAGTSFGTTRTFAATNTRTIGAKSLTGSKASLSTMLGLKSSEPLPIMPRVYPSGAVLATRATAMFPPAPLTFSTTTGLPQASASLSATRRALTSGATPGGNPTRMRTVCSGYPDCASASPAVDRNGSAKRIPTIAFLSMPCSSFPALSPLSRAAGAYFGTFLFTAYPCRRTSDAHEARRRRRLVPVEKPLVARRALAVAALVLRDRLLQVAVFRAREEARLVERGEALLGLLEVARLQVELARVFERAAVLGVDAQRFVVELLGAGEIRGRALAQAVAHQVVPVGVAGVVRALELVDRAGKVLGGDLRAHGGELVGRGLRAGRGVGGKGVGREQQRAGGEKAGDDGVHSGSVVRLSDTVVGVYRHLRGRFPNGCSASVRNYQSLTQCPDRTKSPDGLPPALAGAASMLTASRETLKKSFSEVSASATLAEPAPGTTPTGNAALPSLGRAHSCATEPAGMATGCNSFTVITVPWRFELASTVGTPAASTSKPT